MRSQGWTRIKRHRKREGKETYQTALTVLWIKTWLAKRVFDLMAGRDEKHRKDMERSSSFRIRWGAEKTSPLHCLTFKRGTPCRKLGHYRGRTRDAEAGPRSRQEMNNFRLGIRDCKEVSFRFRLSTKITITDAPRKKPTKGKKDAWKQGRLSRLASILLKIVPRAFLEFCEAENSGRQQRRRALPLERNLRRVLQLRGIAGSDEGKDELEANHLLRNESICSD